MLKLFGVFKYIKGYWKYAWLNIFFNVLFSAFSVVSISLVIPFMDLLFNQNPEIYENMIKKGVPFFSFSIAGFKDLFYYYMAHFIISSGKAQALILICVSVFILTLLKNLFRYMAMYFLAPIRNGVVRDLRNQMMNKVLILPLSYYSEERKGNG